MRLQIYTIMRCYLLQLAHFQPQLIQIILLYGFPLLTFEFFVLKFIQFFIQIRESRGLFIDLFNRFRLIFFNYATQTLLTDPLVVVELLTQLGLVGNLDVRFFQGLFEVDEEFRVLNFF